MSSPTTRRRAGAVDPRRPFAALTFAPGTTFPDYVTVQGTRVPVGQVNYFPHTAESEYDALELRLERRFQNGFSMLSAYTLSKHAATRRSFATRAGLAGRRIRRRRTPTTSAPSRGQPITTRPTAG
jgi:hypothetical protein